MRTPKASEKVDPRQAEFEAVVSSGIFARAPSLAQFLSYVCHKYFAGEADQIKEYNIAVDGLGRRPDFDQKNDAIVRVEASRLRKRLQQYYENEGADHKIRITIPSGQYAPVFVEREEQPQDDGNPAPSGTLSESAAGTVREAGRGWRTPSRAVLWLLAVGLVLIAGTVTVGRWLISSGQFPAGTHVPPVAPQGDEIRILCGWTNGNYVDKRGKVWLPDQYFTGGEIFTAPVTQIFRTGDPEMFRTRREGDFRYDIPLKPGVYELRLWFAETVFGPGNIAGEGESSRLFDVFINDKPVLRRFDVTSNAGANNTADALVFKDVSPAPDGFLHIRFGMFKERPILSGIEILPGIPGRMRPMRIHAGDAPYVDRQGQRWEADCCFNGGRIVTRPTPVTGTADPRLHKSERFGNFTYALPVAEGRYAVTLRFAETWFGPGKPGGGGRGSRIFDVYANGVALLRNFDIFEEAGGPDRAIDKTFHGIVPNAQGKIILSFVPVVNYACVNAIEVVDESN